MSTLRKRRVLLVQTHPIQYNAPLFQRLVQQPSLDIRVAYCSLQGSQPGKDPEFGVDVAWDIPLLEGYPWQLVPNTSRRPGLGRFFGLVNPGLWPIIRGGHFDVVHINGYSYASFWIAILAAKSCGAALMLTSDATSLEPRDGRRWKVPLKSLLLPRILGLVQTVCSTSSSGVSFFRTLGIPPERIALTHYAVDNDRFSRSAASVDREGIRERWGLPVDGLVVLFCAKLTSWKRPLDLMQAFARIEVPNSYLVFAGEGPLRERLVSEASSLGLSDRVRFLGFVNQMHLPEVYAGSDLLVLPSEHEPWGLVVNEAMVCGVPAVVSDRVGARLDLIQDGKTGWVYPMGDVPALAALLQNSFQDLEHLRCVGNLARERMESWSYREHIAGFVEAVERAMLKQERVIA